MGMKLSAEDLLEGLKHYTGSEQLYAHGLNRQYRYTDGVQFLAEHAGAYWLIDAIVAHQSDPKVRAEQFQVWRLRYDRHSQTWLLYCEDGNEQRVAQQEIAFSDFPLEAGGIDLYLVDKTILLPSEY
jgi:hypothetical protein